MVCVVGVVSRASVEVSCLISSDLSNWLGAAALGVRGREWNEVQANSICMFWQCGRRGFEPTCYQNGNGEWRSETLVWDSPLFPLCGEHLVSVSHLDLTTSTEWGCVCVGV